MARIPPQIFCAARGGDLASRPLGRRCPPARTPQFEQLVRRSRRGDARGAMSDMDIPVPQRPEEADTPLFGREKAAESLNAAYAAMRDSGQFRAVTLVGTSGQGKTALIGQTLSRIRKVVKDAPLILSVRARHPGVSYGLFSRLLRERFDVPETLPEAEATRKVESEVRRVLGVENVTDVCFFLGQLMRLSFEESPLTVAATAEPGQSQLMHRGVMRRFLEADSARRAICLVFDDVHRADADSLDLLQSLLTNLDGRILVVCAAERELLAKRESWLGLNPERHSLIELEPLENQTAGDMIRRLMRNCQGGVPDALVQAGVKAAGGNPGRIVQLVRSYFDSGVLEETSAAGGAWRVNLEKLGTVRLPMSVEEAVALRISTLSKTERRVLEHAAAMGAVFWLGGLVALERMDAEPPELWQSSVRKEIERLEAVLDELVERDYLLRLDDGVFPDEPEFVFKHNFEREKLIALTSAARSRRYHQTIADWLSQQTSARSQEEYMSRLAFHLEQAGSMTRAGFAYLEAGDLARRGFALRNASEAFEKGLTLLGGDDARRRIDALHNYGDVLTLLGKTDEAMASFRQMLGIAYAMNLEGKGGAAHNRMGRLYRETGSLDLAGRHLHAARELFLLAGDQRGVAASHDDIGKLLWVRGDYDEALREMRTALDMRREQGDRRSIALSLNNIGLVWMDHGRPANAKEALEASLQIRREINDPVGVADSLNTLGSLHIDQNQFESALECFREAHNILVGIGERTRTAVALTNIGQTLTRLGQHDESVNILTQAIELCEEIGDKLQLAEAQRGLAKTYVLMGRLKEARRCIRTAVDLFAQVRSKAHLAIALRTLGEVTGAGAWGAAHEGRAVEYFMRSIAIAKEIGNEVEVARSYLAFSGYVTSSHAYDENQEILREASKLKEMAEEIFERHRIVVAN